MFEGALQKLRLTSPADSETMVSGSLVLKNADGGAEEVALVPHLGLGIRIEFEGEIYCGQCGELTPRSYGGGYCYACFSTLARCDLCVMSPDRCHYHLGTCREPDWGMEFCMQAHFVYLSNTSGLKVGITREGREMGRWLDQGAIQARVILKTPTRRDAGLAEVAIAQTVSDRTDWRRLVAGDAPCVDLDAAARDIRGRKLHLPDGAKWLDSTVETVPRACFRYPISRYPSRLERLQLTSSAAVAAVEGNLLGLKGQYLLLSTGVFNVSRHAGFRVRVDLKTHALPDTGEQLGLF